MRLILLSILITCIIPATASEITGHHSDYAGRKIRFFKYTDPVTLEKEHLFTLSVDESGNFNVNIPISEVTFAFGDFGIYRGNLFLNPSEKIELKLPPLREKTFAEQKNPYFTPVEFWFATQKGNSLNDYISAFDNQLNQQTDKYFNQLYFGQTRAVFDTIRSTLRQEFRNMNNEVFSHHMELRLKAVEADAFRLQTTGVAPFLAESKALHWYYPAFIQLFDKTFSGRLSFEAQSDDGNNIRKNLASGNLQFFTGFIKENYKVTGHFADLVLLKLLHDGYYSGMFSQESIISLLNNPYFSSHSTRIIRVITKNVLEKLMHLRTGTKAPVICLRDVNGHKACTDHTNKKFKYIVFADTEMIVVKEQLKYLTKINEMFSNQLEIFVVLLKSNIIEMKMFLVQENIPGIHIVDEHAEYIEKYRVKSFPSCFLLNSNHEIVFQETKAPLDGFEQQFGTYLRQYLFQKQRNQ